MSLGLRVREAVNRLQPLGFLYSAYETQLLAQLDRSALPQHVAVLADGNRRWARANAPEQPLVVGYQAGADKLRQFVDWCADLGIGVVTLWVLSTENLTRSESDEVAPLLNVIEHLVAQLATQYRVKVVGDLNLLPEQMAQNLHDAEANGYQDALMLDWRGQVAEETCGQSHWIGSPKRGAATFAASSLGGSRS